MILQSSVGSKWLRYNQDSLPLPFDGIWNYWKSLQCARLLSQGLEHPQAIDIDYIAVATDTIDIYKHRC